VTAAVGVIVAIYNGSNVAGGGEIGNDEDGN
jgi:hypothetical protein